MKKYLFPFLILIPCALSGCVEKEAAEPSAPQHNERRASVRVITAEAQTFEKKIHVVGTARANREVSLSADEGGVVKALFFDKGETVRGGGTLVQLDDSTLRASLAEARAAFQMERLNYERLAALKKKGGAVSDFDLKNSLYKKEGAGARLNVFQTRLAKLKITSPLDGMVDKKMIEVGELIRPGTEVARIAEVDPLRIQTGVAESVIRFIRPGTRVRISFDAFPGEAAEGQVDYIATSANAEDGTFDVEIPLENKSGRLRPGMMARVTIVTEHCEDCLLIPQDALVDTEVGPVVFTVSDDGRVKRRPVSPGQTDRGRVVIASGLEAGERVVITGQRDLVEGEKVNISE